MKSSASTGAARRSSAWRSTRFRLAAHVFGPHPNRPGRSPKFTCFLPDGRPAVAQRALQPQTLPFGVPERPQWSRTASAAVQDRFSNPGQCRAYRLTWPPSSTPQATLTRQTIGRLDTGRNTHAHAHHNSMGLRPARGRSTHGRHRPGRDVIIPRVDRVFPQRRQRGVRVPISQDGHHVRQAGRIDDIAVAADRSILSAVIRNRGRTAASGLFSPCQGPLQRPVAVSLQRAGTANARGIFMIIEPP